MKKFLVGFGAVLAVVLLIVGVVAMSVIGLRNNLVTQEEDIDAQWAQVEVQYQRRFDLIPNLVSSVKGYMEQEREVFDEIAEARTRYAGAASGSQDRVDAANDVESALGRLLVVMESYPELKSDETVQDLMTQLEGTENRISTERYRYNELVRDFNKTIRVFPNSMWNSLFLKFEEKDLFEAAEGAENAPDVDLSIDTDEEAAEEDSESTEETDSSEAVEGATDTTLTVE